ncbi:hypothetical protein DL546_000765 [Coniochaeta pulveracea]|uniref:Putative gamma-glutamylcyclotransferase n=1 Tax=Coniochaeta pulveracea TaxID=177199 RepID=A0A420YIQ2_9PEZI|nr:hypothetical protein DL546_000765 [Coniochaeta pulveracea]
MSDDAWSLIKHEFEPSGCDKETYEYATATHRFRNADSADPRRTEQQETPEDLTSSYILRLGGPIFNAQALKDFADLPTLPDVLHGSSIGNDSNTVEGDDADEETVKQDTDCQFCVVDRKTRLKILKKLAEIQSTFRPTFIRDAKAKKELSPYSLCPTLGIDTTLPQFRPNSFAHSPFPPLQDQYPVWYFFYGTLADPAVLSRLLGLPVGKPPTYNKALIKGGRITTWAGKYLALVNGNDNDVVRGSAYLVNDVEDENALRYYETDKYEVVRCEIELVGNEEKVTGLTFRFRSA